jgi:hypothetical protein
MAFGSERSVKVKLKADISEYIGPLGIAAEATKKFRSSVEGLDVALKPLDGEADKAGDELKQLGQKADAAGNQMKETAGDAGLLAAALKAEAAAADEEVKVKDRNIVQSKIFQAMFKSQTDSMWEGKKVVDQSAEALGRLSDESKTSILNSKVFFNSFRAQVDEMLAAKKATEETAEATKKAGDNWRDAAEGVDLLRVKIEATKQRIKELTEHIRKTGDTSVLGDLKAHMSALESLKKIFPKMFEDADVGGSFWGSILRSSGKGLRAIGGFVSNSPFLATAIGAAIVFGAPIIGSALAGAISGGVGLAGLAGGIALAAKDPLVTSAFSGLFTRVATGLKQAAQVFVEPLRGAADILLASFLKIEPTIGRIFGMLAPTIQRLAAGVGKFAENFFGGLDGSFAKGVIPILNVLAERLPMLGKEVAVFFSSINQPEAVRTFKVLLDVIGGSIVAIGRTIEFLTFEFDMLLKLVAGGIHLAAMLAKAIGPERADLLGFGWTVSADKAMQGYMQSVDGAGTATDNFAVKTGGAVDETDRLTASIKSANDAMIGFFGNIMGVNQAAIEYQQSLADLDEAHKKNGNSLDLVTQKGRDNQRAIDSVAESIEKTREQAIKAGNGTAEATEKANRAYHDQLELLRAHLIALGYDKDKVNQYINLLESVPGSVNSNFQTPGLDTAAANVRSFKGLLNTVPSSLQTTLQVRVNNPNSIVGNSIIRINVQRWGGIAEHADTGLIRDAKVYRSGSRPLYAFAEPQTGGEAFVPKYGDYGRSTSILDHAARWYGGRFMPGGGGGVSGRIEIVLSGGDASTEAVLSLLRKAVNMRGGNVQAVIAGNN